MVGGHTRPAVTWVEEGAYKRAGRKVFAVEWVGLVAYKRVGSKDFAVAWVGLVAYKRIVHMTIVVVQVVHKEAGYRVPVVSA